MCGLTEAVVAAAAVAVILLAAAFAVAVLDRMGPPR